MHHWSHTRRTSGAVEDKDQAGQQMIEFTFTFVMLIAILLALMLLAIVFFEQASIVHAAQTGSRHLLTYPRVPDDEDRFATADEEAIWVITSSVPYLNWRDDMVITIEPNEALRAPGTYVSVKIQYDTSLPQIELPFTWGEGSFYLLPPIRLTALSRRALNWN